MRNQNTKCQQIKQHLLQGIRLNHFKAALPSENQLAKRFTVSRMTARRALTELENDGYVKRIQGKGTFVKKRNFSQGYFKVQPSWQQAEELNVKLTTKVLQLQPVAEPPQEVVERLQYKQQTILARRLHFFNEKPVRYEIRFLRGDLCGGILWENLEKISIHELLVKKFNLPLTKVWQRMTALSMTKEIAEIFHEPPGHPAFHIKRLTYTFEKPVTFVEYYIRGELAFEDNFKPGEKIDQKSLGILY
ncbi:MAG: GntR family transcriptional regulator [Thermodesulfobacteriota bacterium]|nr:GntR family transcriptional regulator [Thermodesulfobacteriota bacterium]